MNITEKLAEAVATGNWQLVSDVHESLTGQALELPGIGPEVIDQLHSFVEGLRLGKTLPMKLAPDEYRETIVEKEPKSKPKKKKKAKSKKKVSKNVTVVDENSLDPMVNTELYEPDRTGHSEARHGGTVKVDKSKVQLISTPAYEGELEQRIAESKATQGTGPKRAPYVEMRYACKLCKKQQKSIRRLSTEEIKTFICDDCGKKG